MKQNKKNKLALTTQTVRSMTIANAQLVDVAGGTIPHTRPGGQCGTNSSGGDTCQQ